MSQSDYRNAIPPRHSFSSLAASIRNASVLPSSNIDRTFARHGLRPRLVRYALTSIARFDAGFQEIKPLTQCNASNFGAQYLHLPVYTQADIVADKLPLLQLRMIRYLLIYVWFGSVAANWSDLR